MYESRIDKIEQALVQRSLVVFIVQSSNDFILILIRFAIWTGLSACTFPRFIGDVSKCTC